MNLLKKSNILLLILSTLITSLSMLFLPFLLSWLLPVSMLEALEYQSWFLFGHLSFLYLITACIYALAGCYIGIKATSYKNAAYKSISVGFGFYFSLIIIGSLYAGAFIFAWAFQYFIFALPGMAVVIIPALFLRFLRPRVKLNQYMLFAIASAIIMIAYIPLSVGFNNVGRNAPELDYMIAIPAYNGVKQQIVTNSQFQLERDLTSDEEQYVGYGSFPIIGYSSESAIMCSEFCYQHLNLQKQDNQYNILYQTSGYDIKTTLSPLVNGGFYPWWMDSYSKFKGLRDNKRPMDIVIRTKPLRGS